MRLLSFLSVLYPKRCRKCGLFIKHDEVFCNDCSKLIKSVPVFFSNFKVSCSIKVYAASAYEDPVKSLVLRKTFSDRLAARQLGQIIFEKTFVKDLDLDYIVPIPLHWTRFARRGFNQSYQMSKVLSKKLKAPVLNILKRNKRTLFQSSLSREERKKNVYKIFSIRRKYRSIYKAVLRDKNVLFVDDLFTTGATIKNAARPIIEAVPKSLSVAVACRAII